MGRRSATRAPETVSLDGFIIEAYVSMNDLPSMTYTRPRRVRHVTRSAASPSPPPPDDDAPVNPNPPPCSICLATSNPHNVLSCASCAKPFHAYCLNPPLRTLPAKGVWTCPFCVKSAARKPYKHRKIFELRNVLDRHPDLCTKEYLQDVVHTTAAIASAAVKKLATDVQSETATGQRRGGLRRRGRGRGSPLVRTETESDDDDDDDDDDYDNDPDFDHAAASSSPTLTESHHPRSPSKRRLTRTSASASAKPSDHTNNLMPPPAPNTNSTPKLRTRRATTTVKHESESVETAPSDASKFPASSPKSSTISSPLSATTTAKPLPKKRNYLKSATLKPSAIKQQPQPQPQLVANNSVVSIPSTAPASTQSHLPVHSSPIANKDAAVGHPSFAASPNRRPKTRALGPVTPPQSHRPNSLVTPTSIPQSATQPAPPSSANRSVVAKSATNPAQHHHHRNNMSSSPSKPPPHTTQPPAHAHANSVPQRVLPPRSTVNLDEKGQALFTLASNMQQSNFSSSPHIRPPPRTGLQKVISRPPSAKNPAAPIEVIDLDGSDDDNKPIAALGRRAPTRMPSSSQSNYPVPQRATRQPSFTNISYAPRVDRAGFPVPQGRVVDTHPTASQQYSASSAYTQPTYTSSASSGRPLPPAPGVNSSPRDTYTSQSARPSHTAYPVPSGSPGRTYPTQQLVSNPYTYAHAEGPQFAAQGTAPLRPPSTRNASNSLPPTYRPSATQYPPTGAYTDVARGQSLPSMATTAKVNHWNPPPQQTAYLPPAPPPPQQPTQTYQRAPPPPQPAYAPTSPYPAPSSQRGAVYPAQTADVYRPPPPAVYPTCAPAAPHQGREPDASRPPYSGSVPPCAPATSYQPYGAGSTYVAHMSGGAERWPPGAGDDGAWPRGEKRQRTDYATSVWQPQRHRRIDAVLTPAVRRNQFNQGRALASLAGAPPAGYAAAREDYSYAPPYASSRASEPPYAPPPFARQGERWGAGAQRVLPPPVAAAGATQDVRAGRPTPSQQGLPKFERVGEPATGRGQATYAQELTQQGPLPRMGSQRAYGSERMSESQARLNQQRGVPEGGLPSVSYLLQK